MILAARGHGGGQTVFLTGTERKVLTVRVRLLEELGDVGVVGTASAPARSTPVQGQLSPIRKTTARMEESRAHEDLVDILRRSVALVVVDVCL